MDSFSLRKIAYFLRSNHWILILGWGLAQIFFGYMLAHEGKLFWGENLLFKLPTFLSKEKLFEYHTISGVSLLAFATVLLLLKFYLIFTGNKKSYKNPFVSMVVENHFLMAYLLILTQYLTMGNSRETVHQVTGISKETLRVIHGYNAYILLLEIIFLTSIKLYLWRSSPKVKVT